MPSRVERARRRRDWPISRFALGQEPSDDLSGTTTVAQRVAMMRALALAAWKVAGLPLPRYRRGNMPVRLVSLHAPNSEKAAQGT